MAVCLTRDLGADALALTVSEPWSNTIDTLPDHSSLRRLALNKYESIRSWTDTRGMADTVDEHVSLGALSHCGFDI